MLVVDFEKFASPQPGNWFSIDVKEPIAHAMVEVLEAAEMNPSDLNGLADPYVKGHLGPYRFRTKTQKKTLAPKWREEFKIPICSWESENMLVIEVRDKDRIFDDTMGDCCVNINELRGRQRHDLWLPLQNIKMGRLHLAVTVFEETRKVAEPSCDAEIPDGDLKTTSSTDDSVQSDPLSLNLSEKPQNVVDTFEPIDIEGKPETGVWIHHPGSEVAQVWEPRKGKIRHQNSRRLNGQIQGDNGQNDGNSTDESTDSTKSPSKVRRGLRKIGSIFRRNRDGDKSERSSTLGEAEPSPHDNIRSLDAKEVGVRWIADDTIIPQSPLEVDEKEMGEENGPESPHGHVKDVAKSILKQAGKSAWSLKSALSRKASRKSKGESAGEDVCSEGDSSDDESLSSALAGPGLVIPGSAVSSGASSVADNNSFKSVDGVIQTGTTPSGNDSFKSTDGTVRNGAVSGNDSFNSVEGNNTVETPK